jgi:OOP family OmpA-OmpF porin
MAVCIGRRLLVAMPFVGLAALNFHPAAALECNRDFQIFFDFGSTAITPAAWRVIKFAARAAKDLQQRLVAGGSDGAVRILVVGHTDTAEAALFDPRLSERRAMATARALIAAGISPEDLSVSGVGEAGLLVPTDGYTAEAENRRVRIGFDQTPLPQQRMPSYPEQ